MLIFNSKQIEKLSNLFMDLAKGLFLAVLLIPALANGADFLFLLRTMISGIMCVYFALWLLELKEI